MREKTKEKKNIKRNMFNSSDLIHNMFSYGTRDDLSAVYQSHCALILGPDHQNRCFAANFAI